MTSNGVNSRSQIIATLGPASGSAETIAKMLDSGMDVVRLNFSHGTHEEHAGYIRHVRELALKAGKKVPIIQDLSGPRANTGEGHQFDASATSVITDKDIRDLEFGSQQRVDYIAQSFVGTALDIAAMRKEIEKLGAKIPIIAKIERKKAVENFDEILSEADAIMVARGDLGLEVPLEDIPFLEKEMIGKARLAKKPVIVATQMMYTMTESPEPTRAEVTDVAYAILINSDAVMLSDETAKGKYPVETVAMMEKIVSRAERAANTADINPL